MLWYSYIYEKTLIKKNELPTSNKDLDNPTYGLFKKPRGYRNKHPPETKIGGNTEHCCRRGGRRENLDLPFSRLFTSFVAWRKREEMVFKETVEPFSLKTISS